MSPTVEAPGLLASRDDPANRERPADLLLLPHASLATALPDGSRSFRTEPICVDVATINSLGPDHGDHTQQRPGKAAYEYAKRKERHQPRGQTKPMKERCREVGLRFLPVIFDYQGGRSAMATDLMRSLAGAVADKEHKDAQAVLLDLEEKVAVILARAVANRARKRTARAWGPPAWTDAAAELQGERADACIEEWQRCSWSPGLSRGSVAWAAGCGCRCCGVCMHGMRNRLASA